LGREIFINSTSGIEMGINQPPPRSFNHSMVDSGEFEQFAQQLAPFDSQRLCCLLAG